MSLNNRFKTAIAVIFGILTAGCAWAGDMTRIDFDAYLWKNRPLVLFAPAPEDPGYRPVAEDVTRRRAQIDDRDMVVIEVFETGLVRVDGDRIEAGRADSLRRRFAASEGKPSAVLIGKDGGIKLRQTGPIDLSRIFALIDTMPMRQREMRSK